MMTLLVPVFVLVVFVPVAVVPLIRHDDQAARALALRRAGLGWMAVFALFFGAFVIGYTVDDPGGWAALLLVASWVVPLVALSWVAWARPQWALPVLGVLLAAAVGYSAWAAFGREASSAIQNVQGPLDAIALFVLSFALAVLGWRRPFPAGVLLLVASVLPMAFHVLGSGAPPSAALGGSLAAATTPGAVTGLLYLLSVLFESRSLAHPSPPKASPTPAQGT
jgi:hypothetical protein